MTHAKVRMPTSAVVGLASRKQRFPLRSRDLEGSGMRTNRLVAALATLGMLLLVFTVPSARADEVVKLQDRLSAEAIVVDPNLDAARLIAAARRMWGPTITVETRVHPNISILTRVPARTRLPAAVAQR